MRGVKTTFGFVINIVDSEIMVDSEILICVVAKCLGYVFFNTPGKKGVNTRLRSFWVYIPKEHYDPKGIGGYCLARNFSEF